MSYQIETYESDAGSKHPIRLSPKVVAAQPDLPSGEPTSQIPAKRSKGGREFGLGPRKITLARKVAAGGLQFTVRAVVPILSLPAFTSLTVGSNFSYDSQTWEIVGKTGEDYR